jgi:hypothetical protein
MKIPPKNQKPPSPRPRGRNLQIFTFANLLILFLLLALRIKVLPNDDTYVYFNYARTTLEGFPFCYDGRGIPSEGFTSILFLLLLLPFEALGANPMFAALCLNLIGLLVGAWVMGKLIAVAGVPWEVGSLLFFIVMSFDPQLLEVLGRGLETMLGVMASLLAIWALGQAIRHKGVAKWDWAYLGFSLMAFLLRPESLPPLALGGLWLLWIHRKKLSLLLRVGALLGILLAYLAGKYAYFGDIFPTGFYRKVASGHLDGYLYLREAVLAYWPWLLAAVALLMVSGGLSWWRKQDAWLKQPEFYLLGLTALYTLGFHYFVLPMVGYGFRHIYLALVILYGLVILGGGKLFMLLVKNKGWQRGLFRGVILVLSVILLIQSLPLSWDRLRLYQRAEQATADFYYVKLGRYLRNKLPRHRQLTLVYGDAGALPYELRCRFIDTQGLSEPAIAQLFGEPDSRAKADRFADHILQQAPDLLIIAGDTAEDGRVPHAITQHDPFRAIRRWGHYDSEKLWAYERFRQAGFKYVGSASGYFYQLHFLLREGSPQEAELQAAIRQLPYGICPLSA